MGLLYLLIVILQVLVGVGLAYHYLLLIVGGRPRHSAAAAEPRSIRFAIALPAHNEESVIGASVARLCEMDYPKDRFDVHVVADYCSDATAQVAHSAGALVRDRSSGPRGCKGYALAWLLERLLESPRCYEAIVVFDADSQVAPDFLRLAADGLAKGGQVVQGRHIIANPEASIFSALADADMRLNNRIRNQAKENLGLSARLMGDGMCFRREILERYPFGAHSLTEDREYSIYLVTQGVRTRFVSEAISVGQATARWGDATGQRLRWYAGAFDLRRRCLGPLLSAAWKRRSLDALDRALELALPPFSVLSVLAVGLLVFQVMLKVLGVPFPLLPGGLLVGAACAYPFLGLLAERAPWSSFRALLYGPVYVLWRVWVGLRVQLRRGQIPWIRTRRAEEEAVTR